MVAAAVVLDEVVVGGADVVLDEVVDDDVDVDDEEDVDDDDDVYVYVVFVQSLSQPLPSIMSPSSHSSVPTTMPSPH